MNAAARDHGCVAQRPAAVAQARGVRLDAASV